MIDHRRAAELSAAALDFPLPPEEQAALALHLRGCPECTRLESALRADARRLGELPALDAPSEVRQAVAWAAQEQVFGPRAFGRPMLVVAVLLLVAAATVGTVVAGSFLFDRDNPSLLPDESASAVASAEPSSSDGPSQSATASPTPSAAPSAAPFVALEPDAWAVVQADGLNLRSDPSLAADRIATVPRGELVLVVDADSVNADGHIWYRVHAGPGELGWAAAASGSEAFLVQPADGTRSWCGPVEEKVMMLGGGVSLEAPPQVVLAGLAVPSPMLTAAELGAAEVAWAGSTGVCADLQIADSSLADAILTVPLDTCGRPAAAGFPGWRLETGDVSVSPTGDFGRRDAWLSEPLFGFEGGLSFDKMPALGQLMSLAEGFQADVCLSGTVSGITNGLQAATELCVFVGEINPDEMEIMANDPALMATGLSFLALPPGSSVDPVVASQKQQRIRLRAQDGIGSAMLVSLADPSC